MSMVGFIGTGLMGEPMAVNLAAAGVDLLVWNRTPAKLGPVVAAGAQAASDVAEVFDRCEQVILMLATPDATDLVLARNAETFGHRVRERLIVNAATASPAWSAGLASDVTAAGGRYVEAPVSGSRHQAKERRLVAMLSGSESDVAVAHRLLEPACRAAFCCGPVPGALRMKLAVNLFMIVMVSGLVEAFQYARRMGLAPELLRDVLASSPMTSNVSQVKADKLVANDWEAQAAIDDVLRNIDLIHEAVAPYAAEAPLIGARRGLYRAARANGDGNLDMVALFRTLTCGWTGIPA